MQGAPDPPGIYGLAEAGGSSTLSHMKVNASVGAYNTNEKCSHSPSSSGWKMRRKGRCLVISGKECMERRGSKNVGLAVGMRALASGPVVMFWLLSLLVETVLKIKEIRCWYFLSSQPQ